jgi:hypothetical protein
MEYAFFVCLAIRGSHVLIGTLAFLDILSITVPKRLKMEIRAQFMNILFLPALE